MLHKDVSQRERERERERERDRQIKRERRERERKRKRGREREREVGGEGVVSHKECLVKNWPSLACLSITTASTSSALARSTNWEAEGSKANPRNHEKAGPNVMELHIMPTDKCQQIS